MSPRPPFSGFRPLLVSGALFWILIAVLILHCSSGCRALVPETIQDIDRAGGSEAYSAQRVNFLDDAALAIWRAERDAAYRRVSR